MKLCIRVKLLGGSSLVVGLMAVLIAVVYLSLIEIRLASDNNTQDEADLAANSQDFASHVAAVRPLRPGDQSRLIGARYPGWSAASARQLNRVSRRWSACPRSGDE